MSRLTQGADGLLVAILAVDILLHALGFLNLLLESGNPAIALGGAVCEEHVLAMQLEGELENTDRCNIFSFGLVVAISQMPPY